MKPFEFIAGAAKEGIVLICDHASNCIPSELGTLGIETAALGQHIAWDIGAGAVTRGLAARLGLPAVLTSVSRLVIDCNRTPGHTGSIQAESHGIVVPGNRDLSVAQRRARETDYFHPYHAAVAAELARLEQRRAGGAVLVSIHSFTPVLADVARPWHTGVLSAADRRLADFFLAALRAKAGIVVGDNEPYSGRHPEGYSCQTHGDAMGRLNVLIEIRQDLLLDQTGIDAWVERLGDVIESLLAIGIAAAERGPGAAMAEPGGAA